MKLPKTIRLPFATPIKVVEVHASDERLVDCVGMWDDEERIIYIRKNLPAVQARAILYHELLHAIHDTAYQLEW